MSFFQVRCRAVPAHWTPDWQEAASIPHARGRSYDADRACGWGPETSSNGGHWLFVPLLAVVVWISSGARTSWSTSWLHCRSCGSKGRRSDLGMMMMTQKKLLVSGIRWQGGKRRGGKPSSVLFGQTFKIFSMATWAWQKQSTKPSSMFFWFSFWELLKKFGSLPGKQLLFCFTGYRPSLAHSGTQGPVILSETPDHHLWTWKPLWSGPAHSQRCSVSAAFPPLQPVSLPKLNKCIWGQLGLSEERGKS